MRFISVKDALYFKAANCKPECILRFEYDEQYSKQILKMFYLRIHIYVGIEVAVALKVGTHCIHCLVFPSGERHLLWCQDHAAGCASV